MVPFSELWENPKSSWFLRVYHYAPLKCLLDSVFIGYLLIDDIYIYIFTYHIIAPYIYIYIFHIISIYIYIRIIVYMYIFHILSLVLKWLPYMSHVQSHEFSPVQVAGFRGYGGMAMDGRWP